MVNESGVDVSYFKNKLELVLKELLDYTPNELHAELTKLATAAKEGVTCEHEWQPHWAHNSCIKCGAVKFGNRRQDREDYGIAAGRTFNSLEEAKFYQKHGRLPE